MWLGLVETHGRRETEALLAGFELIPRKPVIYVNKILSEFDIDKALARRPKLLLLDELAHTNIPGSRHPKRWQDVEELLAAGVDVWTTLNVQHLEGLNDILQRITSVKVRETVPDHVFEDADEIVLVDLPTDELLKRLAEGKVYVPDMADRARKRFFKPENLTALRELALRRAAERVDADLVDHMQAQAIDGPWPAGERILACVGPDSDATSIVRAAKRLADVMDAPWLAVTVEGPGEQLSAADRRHVDAAMKLARSLGATTTTLAASDIAAELLRFSKFENVTQIVLGRSRGGFLAELLRRSLPHELLRRADGIAVHVITGRQQDKAGPALAEPCRATGQARRRAAALVDAGRRQRRRRRPGADAADDVSQHLDDLPDGGRVLRRHLRYLAGGLRIGAVVPRLQPVFHRAPLHLHRRAAARAPGARHLSGDLRRHVDHGGTHPRAGAAGREAHARGAPTV